MIVRPPYGFRRLAAWVLALAVTAQLLLAPPIAMAMAAADRAAMANCHAAEGPRHDGSDPAKGGHAGHDSCLLCKSGLSAMAAVGAASPAIALPAGRGEVVPAPVPAGLRLRLAVAYRSRAPPAWS